MKEGETGSETFSKKIDRRLSCTPMMDLTDRYCRYFLRLISRLTLLYTEMITTNALLHGDCERFLRFDPLEQPIAVGCKNTNDPYDIVIQ